MPSFGLRVALLVGALLPGAAAHAQILTTLYNFAGGTGDGGQPLGVIGVGNMLTPDVKLYGATYSGGGSGNFGVAYKINTGKAGDKVLYNFGTADGHPNANLIEVGGQLYGTSTGSQDSNGTIFKLDPVNGAVTTLYYFAGGPSDGAEPAAGLTYVAGVFYGTTLFGGANGNGTLFKFDPAGGTETVLYSFGAVRDASQPTTPLVYVQEAQALFGVTYENTVGNAGTVYEYNLQTNTESVVFNFSSTHGEYPNGGLVKRGMLLWGTTASGGTHSAGTVYTFNPLTYAENVVYNFQGPPDARNPTGTLVVDGDFLYGTSQQGGSGPCGLYGCGTIFVVEPNGFEQVLHNFIDSDGETPLGGLVARKAGNAAPGSPVTYPYTLYGTTYTGGSTGNGTVFEFEP